jgi:uncharacterized membrane protein
MRPVRRWRLRWIYFGGEGWSKMSGNNMTIKPIVLDLLAKPKLMRERIIRLTQTADPYTLTGVLLVLEQVNKAKIIRDLYKAEIRAVEDGKR